jgi:hypothetical protein
VEHARESSVTLGTYDVEYARENSVTVGAYEVEYVTMEHMKCNMQVL